MKAQVLLKILQTIPSNSDQISIKGRRTPIISVSVPSQAIRPRFWTLVTEAEVYRREGFSRWTWNGPVDDSILNLTLRDLRST
jgi:hypothetical protein